jgi:hypothetical protein
MRVCTYFYIAVARLVLWSLDPAIEVIDVQYGIFVARKSQTPFPMPAFSLSIIVDECAMTVWCKVSLLSFQALFRSPPQALNSFLPPHYFRTPDSAISWLVYAGSRISAQLL